MAPTGEQLLQAATNGEPIESKDWPQALDTIFTRLEQIIKDEFPTPTIPAPDPPPPPLLAEPSSQSSTSTNKENAPPRPPVPSFSASQSASQGATQTTQADMEMNDSTPSMPAPLMDLYELIRTTLTKSFSKNPPHTIQRLAELILYPKTHYRYLPPYLRAIDRVICVSSGANIFPLPQASISTSASGGGLLNGTTNTASAGPNSLGSDESLGGALLTPIPWLKPDRGTEEHVSPTQPQSQGQVHGHQQQQNELKSEETEMVEGPNGVGRIETVSVINGGFSAKTSSPSTSPNASPTAPKPANGNAAQTSVEESLREAGAVTQGELLRLEQEAGVVPVSVASRSPGRNAGLRSASAAGGEGAEGEVPSVEGAPVEGEEQDEIPHARGPEEIGAEDVGPGLERFGSPAAGGLDLEKAVGRSLPHGEGSREVSAKSEEDVEMKESDLSDSATATEESAGTGLEATKDDEPGSGAGSSAEASSKADQTGGSEENP